MNNKFQIQHWISKYAFLFYNFNFAFLNCIKIGSKLHQMTLKCVKMASKRVEVSALSSVLSFGCQWSTFWMVNKNNSGWAFSAQLPTYFGSFRSFRLNHIRLYSLYYFNLEPLEPFSCWGISGLGHFRLGIFQVGT